jgi:3-oxoadipate enol-lactonase
MSKAKVNGVEIYYEVHGEGYPLIMIQGYSGSSEDWNQVEPRAADLAKHYKVILIDSRGTGRSSAPPGEYSIKDMADDTAALLEYLHLPKAHVLGTSMGGMIAQEIALNYPEKVGGLILLYTGPGGHLLDLPGQRENMAKLAWVYSPPEGVTGEDVQNEILRIAYYKDYLTKNIDRIKASKYVYPTPASTLEKQYRAILEFDTTRRLGQIQAKTLIMHGEDDILIFPEAARFLAMNIRGSELHMFKETGHALSEERWREIRPIILNFLANIS